MLSTKTLKVPDEYFVDLAIEIGVSEYTEELYELLSSKDLMVFLSKRLSEELRKIALTKLSTVNTDEDIDASVYLNSMKFEINDNEICFFNNAKVDLSTRNISPENRANYSTLSLAKIVEYGIGYTGLMNTSPAPTDWEYDVNNHGSKGWVYKDSSGRTFWTNGFEGRLIYYTFMNYIRDNISNLIKEYILTKK